LSPDLFVDGRAKGSRIAAARRPTSAVVKTTLRITARII
jgi:hypothetical protein